MNSLQEVKQAVDKGLTVYWQTGLYKVIRSGEDYLIKSGSYCVSLFWADGETSDYKAEDFFIEQGN
jgi:hypothetical protein